ncbi:DUF1223 domain-containing protein [Candidatus Binatus sp.]|uniref:DUF1223 domain-containing protein n=1 Tax=Candidatus Binatus sp. TaxID=2811406 RepID=UPI003C70F368
MRNSRGRFGLVPWIVSVATVAAIGLGLFHKAVAFSQTDAAADGAPVVLELFTSEGCSSCPPADALITELGSSMKSVIPLAYHVDYWNHLGWADPFSSGQWSERQTDYARAMNLDGEYTPQMVIGGGRQCSGSDAGSIARAVAAARSETASGRTSIQTSLIAAGSRKLQVRVNAQLLTAAGPGRLVVMLAIYENGLVSKIGAGENGGREITYDYTVRKLLPAFELDATQPGSFVQEMTVDLDPSWSLDHLGVAAFIQDPTSLRIEGASAEYPVAKN